MAATLLGCSGLTALAQESALPPSPPRWDHLITLQPGYGYKDNLTLSEAEPEASPFFRLGADAMVYSLNPEGPQFSAFGFGEHRQYLDATVVKDEQLALTHAQVKLPVRDTGEASLAAEYVFQNQVLDVSVTEDIPEAVRVLGHSLTGRPGGRLNLPGSSWAALEFPVTRQWYAAPLDDYWEGGPKAEWRRNYARNSYVGVSYEFTGRAYDHLEKLDHEGLAIPGTHRRVVQHDARLAWRHGWDAPGRWRTTTRVGYKGNRDLGEGYFNYNQIWGAEELRYRTRLGEASLQGRAAYYRFPVQKTVDEKDRQRVTLSVSLRGERRLTRSLRLTAAYEFERVWSNETLESYAVNTIVAGVNWEF